MNNWVRYFKTRQSESEYFWNFLTCLSVPEFDVPVVATAEELCARVVEGYVPHGLFVTAVGPHTAPVVVHLPDLHKEKVDKCQALCNQYVSQLYIEVETMQKLLSFSIKVSVGETIWIPGRLRLWKPNKPWSFCAETWQKLYVALSFCIISKRFLQHWNQIFLRVASFIQSSYRKLKSTTSINL